MGRDIANGGLRHGQARLFFLDPEFKERSHWRPRVLELASSNQTAYVFLPLTLTILPFLYSSLLIHDRMGIEANSPTALMQVTVQSDWTDVVAEVLRLKSTGTFWVSCYKRGKEG